MWHILGRPRRGVLLSVFGCLLKCRGQVVEDAGGANLFDFETHAAGVVDAIRRCAVKLTARQQEPHLLEVCSACLGQWSITEISATAAEAAVPSSITVRCAGQTTFNTASRLQERGAMQCKTNARRLQACQKVATAAPSTESVGRWLAPRIMSFDAIPCQQQASATEGIVAARHFGARQKTHKASLKLGIVMPGISHTRHR